MASTVTGTSRRLRPERFLQGLNPRQLEAVKHGGGPLLVLAGAGSGKTKVLTSRIGYLIASGAVAPEQVLAITFTNKAAKEMKERLAASLGPLVKDMWVSTFHSACVRMLRPYADRVGLTKRFTILSEDDCKRLLRDIADDLNIDVKMMPPGGAKAAISAAKNRLVDPRRALHRVVRRPVQCPRPGLPRVPAAPGGFGLRRLRRPAGPRGHAAHPHPDVREHYRAQFAQVLVDEYQDTNRAQSVIVEELASGHGNLCCVGDGDQSIYGFRAADVGNILNFTRTFPGATSVLLEQNFRSTGTILDAANAVIAHNADRPEKNLWTMPGRAASSPSGPPTTRRTRRRGWPTRWPPGAGRGRPGDIAVLCRAKTLTRPIEAEIVRRGIPVPDGGRHPVLRAQGDPRSHRLPPPGRQPPRRALVPPMRQRPPEGGGRRQRQAGPVLRPAVRAAHGGGAGPPFGDRRPAPVGAGRPR